MLILFYSVILRLTETVGVHMMADGVFISGPCLGQLRRYGSIPMTIFTSNMMSAALRFGVEICPYRFYCSRRAA